ncbi:ABC transporter permease [Acuticoccus sp. I52.16.1]|uniref:ABC transporter permease n=1 Tax=Acuticoccus sp. I52.16.1 TaxID=2928472 RepID=UPI001FD411A0|nr:ABC transporter permease [Acuticoccus sp. I52.16.1]UOM36262.1 ABC transporter permease [Acuticoccus sp. I52.16.1]
MALAIKADGALPAAAARRAGGGRVLVGIAGAVVFAIILAAVFAPWLVTHDPFAQDLFHLNTAPGGEHPLGTDHIGRDVYSRLVMGARLTLIVGAGGAAIAFLLGGALGLLGMALGRWGERVVFAVIDLVRAVPGILLALLIIVAVGEGTGPVTLALGVSFAPFFAYVARATFKREAAQDYVRVAGLFGGGRLHVLRLHILPNLCGSLVTQAAIILPRCIVTESVLSFLGLGSSPDAPTWGRMISDASRYLEVSPHAILAPIAALVALTVSLLVLGDALRERLDPLRAGALPPGAVR